ncbi:MAG: DinB family protein [Nocardioidaceae bacterium]
MSEQTPSTTRVDPPYVADERTMLEAWLDFHRETLLWKCEGLTDEQLTIRAAEPSSLTLLGLVRHMAEVERGWFTAFRNRPYDDWLFSTKQDPDADFNDISATTVEADKDVFRRECEASRAKAAGLSLDDTETSRRGHEMSLRWIYVHMIEEYARHNGHADLLRERIDGATGD